MVLALALVGVSYWMARQALPDFDGVVNIADLDQPVRVRFDQLAVPYIQGRSEHDLHIAQGFVTASERMFQMDLLRRAALGQLSEVFGSSCLVHDRLARTLGFNRIAREQYREVSDEERANLKAYAQGVNAYISESAAHPAVEFLLLQYSPRSWEPQDSLAILDFLQYQMDESWRLDEFRTRMFNKVGAKLGAVLFDQIPSVRPLKPRTVPGQDLQKKVGQLIVNPEINWGSSAWAISGQLSSSHGSLLAADKHGPFLCPDLFYSCSLSSDQMHVAGASIPGIPGVIFGRNENIAWAANSLKADSQDLFIEHFSDKFASKYRTATGWATAQEITEEIGQRFGPNILHKVTITRHGPVLFRDDPAAVSLSWTGFNSASAIEAIWQLDRAKDFSQFKTVLKNYKGSPHTFIFADTKGNIALQVAGAIPIRQGEHAFENKNCAAMMLLSGQAKENNWLGSMKFEDLPFSFNSKEGFVVANDAKYTGVHVNSNPVPSQRVRDVLTQYRKIGQLLDLPEMAALQCDEQAWLFSLVKSEIKKAMEETNNIDVFAQDALSTLDHSDGQLRGDTASASIYESFLTTILRRSLASKIDKDLLNEYVQRFPSWTKFVAHVLKDKPKDLLPAEENDYRSFILTSFSESLKNVRLATKANDSQHWLWKKLHQINLTQSARRLLAGPIELFLCFLAPGNFGVGGDQDCVNSCNYELDDCPSAFTSTCGPTIRAVIDLSDGDKFYQTLMWGQSGHFLSNHHVDQLKSWLNGEPTPIAFSSRQLEKQMQHTLVLTNRYE